MEQYTRAGWPIPKGHEKDVSLDFNNKWSVFKSKDGLVKITTVKNFRLSKDLTPQYDTYE
jgi:hypothetical protein